jgi:hypothetical protein
MTAIPPCRRSKTAPCRQIGRVSSSLRVGNAVHQVLLQPAQAFVNMVQGVGVGEAEITFAVQAEIDTWGDGDLGMFEDVEG